MLAPAADAVALLGVVGWGEAAVALVDVCLVAGVVGEVDGLVEDDGVAGPGWFSVGLGDGEFVGDSGAPGADVGQVGGAEGVEDVAGAAVMFG